jgi:hypothetical protein
LLFADGLQGWLRGDDEDESTAAGVTVAEILLEARLWLRHQLGRDK